MAILSYAIVTLDEARTWLKVNAGQEQHDFAIETIVNGITDDLESMSGRVFKARDLTEVYDGNGRESLTLRKWPVNSVASIAIDGDTLSEDDYTIDHRLGRVRLVSGLFDSGFQNIDVTYNAGYAEPATVPAHVTKLALDLLSYFYPQWVTGSLPVTSISLGNSGNMQVNSSIPRHLRDAISALCTKRA